MSSLPQQYISQDSLSMVLVYFALSGLDIIDALGEITEDEKQKMIDWIYEHQVLPTKRDDETVTRHCGFRGSKHIITWPTDLAAGQGMPAVHPLDCSHVTMTYAALCSLIILGDDLSRVDRPACLRGIAALQEEDGGFLSSLVGGEKDVRFVYSAAVAAYILGDVTAINIDKAMEYMQRCQTYEGGFGATPGSEAHGGPTYCVIASMSLLGHLESGIQRKDDLLRWCLLRYTGGFNGRPDKDNDSCYTFWIGASLQILGHADLVSRDAVLEFVLRCRCHATKGFSKHADTDKFRGYADLMHSYLASAGLSCLGVPELLPLRAPINLTERTHRRLQQLQEQWQS